MGKGDFRDELKEPCDFTPEMVRDQLARMLASKDFQASKRLKAFLAFTVEETLAGRAGNIKAYNIAVGVFGRSEKFDPILDPIVRVEAGKLRSHLERYYLLHQGDPLHISIPRGSYVPVFRPLLAAREATETLPGPASSNSAGSNKENSDQSRPNPNSPSSAEPNSSGSAEIHPSYAQSSKAPALPFSGSNPSSISPSAVSSAPPQLQKERRPLMMVLPLQNISETADLNCFIEGLTESLLVELASNKDVDVLEVPFTPSASNSLLDMTIKAKDMGARFVLHGRVQCMDEYVRIYMGLTDTSTQNRLWTEKFDTLHNPKDLLAAQDSITRQVAAWVADSFGLINRTLLRETSYKQLDEIGTYEATLRYHAWVSSFGKDLYIDAKKAMQHAFELDPQNTVICAFLSDIYSSDFQFGYDLAPGNLDKALSLAQKAIGLDATCQSAHWALAFNYFLRRDKTQLEKVLNNLMPLGNVSPYTRVSLGLLIGMSLSLEEGRRIMQEAAELNPYSPNWRHVVPFMLCYSQNMPEEALFEAMQINAPDCIWDPLLRAVAHGRLGQQSEAQKAMQHLLQLEPEFKAKRERLLYALFFEQRWVGMITKGLEEAGLKL